MDLNRDERSELGLITLLSQLSKAINKRAGEGILGMRLKPYVALGYVRDHPGLAQHELEGALLMDANGVVILLNELEAAHHVLRRRDPQDRRRHILELTAEGRRALERADRAREGMEDEILATLSPEERRTMRRLVERVLDSISLARV